MTADNSLHRLTKLTVGSREVYRKQEFDLLWRWIIDFTKYLSLRELDVTPLRRQGCKIRKSVMIGVRAHRASLRVLRLDCTDIPPEDLRRLLLALPHLEELAFSATNSEIAEITVRTLEYAYILALC